MKFEYTKANGEVSQRNTVVVAQPRKNWLMLDVAKITEEEAHHLQEALNELDKAKQDFIAEVIDGAPISYKTFIPEQMKFSC